MYLILALYALVSMFFSKAILEENGVSHPNWWKIIATGFSFSGFLFFTVAVCYTFLKKLEKDYKKRKMYYNDDGQE